MDEGAAGDALFSTFLLCWRWTAGPGIDIF